MGQLWVNYDTQNRASGFFFAVDPSRVFVLQARGLQNFQLWAPFEPRPHRHPTFCNTRAPYYLSAAWKFVWIIIITRPSGIVGPRYRWSEYLFGVLNVSLRACGDQLGFNQPGTINDNENPPGNLEKLWNPTKNHENHKTTLKNHGNQLMMLILMLMM